MAELIKIVDSNGLLYYHQKLKAILGTKVDKKDGFSLISDAEILRLSTVVNYNDTEVQNKLSSIAGKIDALEKGTYDDSELRGLITGLRTDIDALSGSVENWDAAYTHSQATHAPISAQENVIETIKVNGVETLVTTKSVDIKVPVKTSDITNDSNFQTSDDVQILIDNAIGDISGVDFQVVEALPEEGDKGVIYLVSNGNSESNIYDEYIFVNNKFEIIGTTDVDLSGYVQKTDVITNADIDAIFAS